MNITGSDHIWIKLWDFPKGDGKVISRTEAVRNDDKALILLDYDMGGKLVAVEIMEHMPSVGAISENPGGAPRPPGGRE